MIVPLAAPAASIVMNTLVAAFWLAVGAGGSTYFYHWGRIGTNPAKPLIRVITSKLRPAPEPASDAHTEPKPPRAGL